MRAVELNGLNRLNKLNELNRLNESGKLNENFAEQLETSNGKQKTVKTV